MSGSCLGKNNTCETESKEEENDSNQIKLDDNNFIYFNVFNVSFNI